jgi:hypothetical protein
MPAKRRCTLWVDDDVLEALADLFGVGLPRFALSQGRLHHLTTRSRFRTRLPGPGESCMVIRRVRPALTATAGKRAVYPRIRGGVMAQRMVRVRAWPVGRTARSSTSGRRGSHSMSRAQEGRRATALAARPP